MFITGQLISTVKQHGLVLVDVYINKTALRTWLEDVLTCRCARCCARCCATCCRKTTNCCCCRSNKVHSRRPGGHQRVKSSRRAEDNRPRGVLTSWRESRFRTKAHRLRALPLHEVTRQET